MTSKLDSAVEDLEGAAKVVEGAASVHRANEQPAHGAAATALKTADAALKDAKTAVKDANAAVIAATELTEWAKGPNRVPESDMGAITERAKRAADVLKTATKDESIAQDRVDRVTVAINSMAKQGADDVTAERLELLAAEIRDVLTRLRDEALNPSNADETTVANEQ
jgi:hypothetical protein